MNRVKYDSKREGYKFNYSFEKLKQSIQNKGQHGGSMSEKSNNELLFSQEFYKNKTLKIYKLADDVLKI